MKDDYVLLDEFQVAIYVPKYLPDDEVRAIRAGLATKKFRGDVRKGVRQLLRKQLVFVNVKIQVTR